MNAPITDTTVTLPSWITVENWDQGYLLNWTDAIGLYRFKVKRTDEVVYVGKATSLPGGFAKRVSDLLREKGSGRTHYAGQMIRANRSKICLQILPLDIGARAIEQCKESLLRGNRPIWNVGRKSRSSRRGSK